MNPLRLLFPRLEYQFVTELSAHEALSAIAVKIGPEQSWTDQFLGRVSHPFVGSVHGPTFTMVRAIGYRNSFLPRIHGVIESTWPVTVRVRMTLGFGVVVFGALWCSFVAFFLYMGLTQAVEAGKGGEMIVYALCMLGVYSLISNLGFWPEARRARAILAELMAHPDA